MLAELGDEASVLAGGQSLVPMLNLRLARPSALVDVGRVAALSGISANGALRLGATTRQADALRSPLVAERAPLLSEALRHVGHPATRSRGTARRQHRPRRSRGRAARRPARTRRRGDRALPRRASARSPAASLFLGPFTTALADGELLTALRLPDPPAGARHGFAEIARRRGDFALAGAAVVVAPGLRARRALRRRSGRLPRRRRPSARSRRAPARRRRRSSRPPRASRPAIPHATAAYRTEAARVATLRALAGRRGGAWH